VTGRNRRSPVVSFEGSGQTGSCHGTSPRRAPPLVRFRSRSAPSGSAGSASWVPRSLLALAGHATIDQMIALRVRRPAPAGPRGLPGRAGRPHARRQEAITLTELRPLQGVTTRVRRAAHGTYVLNARVCAVPSWSSVPFDAFGGRSPRSVAPGLPPPVTFRLQGFAPS